MLSTLRVASPCTVAPTRCVAQGMALQAVCSAPRAPLGIASTASLLSTHCRRLLALARHLNRARGDGSAPQGHHIVHSAALSSMAESSSAAAAAAAAKQKAAGAAALHPSPSAQQLSQLTHILNARDMAEASRKLKPGMGRRRGRQRCGRPACSQAPLMALLRRLDPLSHPRLCLAGRLFRSGSPAHAELEDVLLLRRELGVRHMLDFRSADEHQEDTAWSLMLSNGVIKTYDTAGSVTSVRMRGAGRGRWAGHERRVTAGRRRHGQPGAGADVCPPPALAVRPTTATRCLWTTTLRCMVWIWRMYSCTASA